MASNDYQFLSRWRVEGTCAQAYDLLVDVPSYLRWWPQVYLKVTTITPPGEHGSGAVVDLLTKGRLPYKLRWQASVLETRYPHSFTIGATGDFVGRGVWTIQQDGEHADIVFDWRLRAEKPLLRDLSFLFKPLFSANHRWAMARGEEGLRRELGSRRTSLA